MKHWFWLEEKTRSPRRKKAFKNRVLREPKSSTHIWPKVPESSPGNTAPSESDDRIGIWEIRVGMVMQAIAMKCSLMSTGLKSQLDDWWIEFVGSLLGSKKLFPSYSGCPLSSKTNNWAYLIWRRLKQGPYRWSRNIKNDNVVQLIVRAKSYFR